MHSLIEYIFICRCFKYETVEEIIEALKNEKSKFAQSCLKSMSELCPLSLKITLHALRLATYSSMFQCIDRDSRGWSAVPVSNNEWRDHPRLTNARFEIAIL